MTNNGCKKYCEVMNRPAYIVLFKGDDSDFQDNQSVDIVIDTELDTTGMKAHFRFMDFVQDFDSIPENKTLSLVFPNAKTSEFPLGAADATLRFEDASGKFRTVSNRIHIVVTNSVHEAYDNEDGQSITVTVKGTVTWEMIQGKPTFATVATSGSYNDLTDRPTIPAPITIDPALSQTSENPVQNKVVAKALYTGFTEWQAVKLPEGFTFVSATYDESENLWLVSLLDQGGVGDVRPVDGTPTDTSITDSVDSPNDLEIRRTLITPTKTSQLTNDGPSSGPNVGHPFATTNQIPAPVDISGKLDGAAAYPAWISGGHQYYAGDVVSYGGSLYLCTYETATDVSPDLFSTNWSRTTIDALKQDALTFAQLAAANSGATAEKVAAWDGYAAQIAAKASMTDLPYALVTPGEWEFSGGVEGFNIVELDFDDNLNEWIATWESDDESQSGDVNFVGTGNEMSLTFSAAGGTWTATRASLPGHLLDRAGNRVVISGDTTLMLPAAVPGYLRDFLVRLEIGGSTVPTITFSAPTGETITYETDGDEFPVPDEAGNWLYSFTESCVAHKFAVSLKKVNEVAAPQTQGGS